MKGLENETDCPRPKERWIAEFMEGLSAEQNFAFGRFIQGAEHLTHLGSSPRAGHIVVAVVEILGGLFALIGFLTRWAGAALFALTIWRIIEGPGVRAFTHPDYQLYFAVLMMTFALFGLGGGKWSVDASSKKKEQ